MRPVEPFQQLLSHLHCRHLDAVEPATFCTPEQPVGPPEYVAV
jgi:hypothetical protein